MKFLITFSVLIILTGSACQRQATASVLSTPVDIPEAFIPVNGTTLDSVSCKSPLIDPHTGDVIRMVEASGGFGKYEVPEGKYGLKPGEYLKIDCSTGKVTGVVRK